MMVKSIAAGIVAGLMCVSCGPNDPGAAARGQGSGKTLAGAADTTKSRAKKQGELRIPNAPIERVATAGGMGQATASPTASAVTDVSDMPLAPKDAQWTIFCATIADPNHIEISRALKTALVKRTD